MKWYNHYAYCETCDGDAQSWMEEEEDGEYVKLADVEDLEQKYKDLLMVMEEQYIPRPDPEEARKAVDELEGAARMVAASEAPIRLEPSLEYWTTELKIKKAALLRLMGVA